MVDMDNTLYSGILGEDGPERVVPHTLFQKQLKVLKNQGVLLGLTSKNDYEDAHKLFELSKDFVLRWEDFSSHCISWKPKVEAIAEVANFFNINTADILFIDDNFGEIS